ncbi:MAG TPA: hypothetical protein VGZ73_14120 [Bryobacteraceae bacterium]|jgi:hypothetical protein|nr:hypothetical protein [Bryobacteraceae bacterium]
MRIFMLAPALAGLFVAQLPAQDNTELLNRMKAMEDRIKSLEAEVQTLKQTAAVAPPPAAVTPPATAVPALPPQSAAAALPQEPVTLGGAGPAASKALNPDISAIGDFIGAVGQGANRRIPSLEMHESELGFQEVIDPYARADFFISFSEQGVNLEEGYLTLTSLPAGLQVKVGKMRAAFGRVNTLHNHVLPWTDRPLVNQNLVGGEDGIDDAGLSVSRILPAPKGIFLEGTAQLFRGDSTNVFQANRRNDVSTVEHLHAYHDISESTNLDIGGSYARGHSPFANGTNQLYSADLTLRWKPLRRAIYHSFVGRSEFVWARTTVSPTVLFGLPALAYADDRYVAKPFGFYVSGDYQLGRRYFIGGRFDRSQRGACLPTNPPTAPCGPLQFEKAPSQPLFRGPLLQDTGGSLILTYWPSEFSQIRGQLRRTRYGEGLTANELIFQFMFSMGAHGAHPF